MWKWNWIGIFIILLHFAIRPFRMSDTAAAFECYSRLVYTHFILVDYFPLLAWFNSEKKKKKKKWNMKKWKKKNQQRKCKRRKQQKLKKQSSCCLVVRVHWWQWKPFFIWPSILFIHSSNLPTNQPSIHS